VKLFARATGLALLGVYIALALGHVLLGQQPAAAKRQGDREYQSQERYLYVATLAQSTADPDFMTIVGADPRRGDFGRIVNRIDMPNVGDELHHFGYSSDQQRLIVPGLFSNRLHVFDILGTGRQMRLRAVNEELVNGSGYVIPHSVIAPSAGHLLITMIGAATPTTQPGGIVAVDDKTGAFVGHFGPGPSRQADDLGPRYMYDFDALPAANRGISSTFGPPALCGGGIDPNCLGDEVAVWDLQERKVIQVANLGPHSGALEVRFIHEPGVRRAFINTPGTSAVWLANDDDNDGIFEFQQILGSGDGLALPVDMLLSYDHRFMYLTNWFGGTVQQFDISDPFNPVLTATVPVPHPNMLRLSRDNRRLYVSNSLLSTWDNDARFGPARNDRYGIWLFGVDPNTGALSSITSDGSAWVSFENVRKKATTGPAGPHMMLFDPSVRLAPGEH
jgi:selenium-binding protein 1